MPDETDPKRHPTEEAGYAPCADVAPELRTPLLSVLVPLESLLGGGLTGAQQRLVETAHDNAIRLLLLVSGLLNSSEQELRQRRQAEDQARALREMNQKLIRSNQELDDFAHIASHDLREPLRGISNYSQFLIEDYGDKLDDEGRRKLETLGRLSQRMADLIDSLHQFSRLGRVELAVAPTDLNDVLAGVLDGLRITLEEKRVEVRIPRPLPTVACDRVRVGEIFHNLIANAVKYNDKPHKWVEVGFRAPPRPGGPGVFSVRDNGIGIHERHLEAIFKMFKRLHGRDQYGGGTGVGLTIAKRVVERHGGRIWAESVYGQGTAFSFTLAPEGDGDEGEV